MVMRRFDVWVGRVAAVVGIVYVLLASLWPLAASAGEEGTNAVTASPPAFADRVEATIGMPPMEIALIDIRIGRVLAEVVARRERDEISRVGKTRSRDAGCAWRGADGACDAASSAPLLPDSSTMTILLIPLAALAFAAASALLHSTPSHVELYGTKCVSPLA